MRHDGRTLLAMAEFDDHRYVQVWVHHDGVCIGEVISNLNIGDSVALQPEAEATLRELGFAEPAYGPNPNWWIAAQAQESIEPLVTRLTAAVYRALGEHPANPVSVSTWAIDVPEGYTMDEMRGPLRVYVDDAFDDFTMPEM